MEARRVPFDPDELFGPLQPGSVIPRETIESILKVQYDHRLYATGLMTLVKKAQRYLSRREQRIIVVCVRDGALYVPLDAERIDRGEDRCSGARRVQRDEIRQMMDIDISRLTGGEREKHRRVLELETRAYAATKAAMRPACLRPAKTGLEGRTAPEGA